MPSTYSNSLRLELVGDGEQSGLWGQTTNKNFGTLVESSIAGNTSIDVTLADVTLTALNGLNDQARKAYLIVSGTPGITRIVTIPNTPKGYTVKNFSDSTVQIKTASGSPFDCPTNSESYIYCDGFNAISGKTITDVAETLTASNDLLTTITGLGLAPLNNPAFTGVPTAPTAATANNTTQLATTAFVQSVVQASKEALFPIGSVYINASNNASPSSLLGFGTWVEIGAGRVLVGQDVGDALFDTLEETGGSKDAVLVSHDHGAATGDNSVDHTHTFSGTTTGQSVSHNHSGTTDTEPDHQHVSFGTTGGGFSTGLLSPTSGTSNGNYSTAPAGSHDHSFTTGNASSDHTHNYSGTTSEQSANHNHSITAEGVSATNANLQPYVVVKMWKRTA